ncbi:MAG TPA: NADPH:quinone oxidoreductase family protein [Acidimicrobiales bacterium]|nr:NADPH:quinone oxidoreductase family protein [Acidimicrobiales bacterium]
MRRIVCRELGPLDRLVEEDAPDLTPAPDQVVVAVRAAGVNYVDALFVQGGYQIKPPLPFTPGSEIAGQVVAVGDAVQGVGVGDRVAASVGLGGYAEQVAVPAASVLPLPAGLSFGRAAAMVQSYATALFALTRRTTVREGETVLVLGAGGGVGLATIDVARSLGLDPIAAASSDAKLAAARAAGARGTIDYESEDLKTRARELGGGGVDVVVDPVGGRWAEPALRALAVGGRYLVIGFAGGEIPRLPINHILLNNRTVVGVDWGAWAMQNPGDNQALVADLMAAVAAGRLHPPEPASYPLADAAGALADLQARRVVGKLVLEP